MTERQTNPSEQLDAERFACHVARLMSDDRCEDVLVLDVRRISQVADFLVIGTGTSDRQMQSVAEDLKRLARLDGQSVYRSHGSGADQWVVVDFVDVVAHLFDAQQRAYYDLESLWGDAGRIDWRKCTSEGQFAHLHKRP